MPALAPLAEILVAAGTLILAYFAYTSVAESKRVREAQYDVNLDLFVVAFSNGYLHYKVANYGPGVAKDVSVDGQSKEGRPFSSSYPYLAPITPSEPSPLGILPDQDNEFSFTISYSDLLRRKKTLKGRLAKANGMWEFSTESGTRLSDSVSRHPSTSKTVTGLWAATIIFALLSVIPFNLAWQDLAKPGLLSTTEFFISIGFVFDFGAFTAFFTGVTEFRAERRMEELRSLVHR